MVRGATHLVPIPWRPSGKPRLARAERGNRRTVAMCERHVDASPETIYRVLSDPDSYGYWVVGSKEIRDADAGWPAPGTRFQHTLGWGPFEVKDHTVAERMERPHLLELRAKARPFGTAKVRLELAPEGTGTRVRMYEDAADILTALVFNPLTHLLVWGRNEESLRRLAELAERQRQSAKAA